VKTSTISSVLIALAMAHYTGPVRAAEESPGAWGVVDLSGPIGEPAPNGTWNFAVDIQARYFDIGTGISQWLARGSAGYRFANGIELRFGYGRFRARNRRGAVVN
jgi:hypothetical protein